MAIQIKSFNQTLGDMVRKILADTPLNDLNAGSVLLTLLEAAAANDFENNTAILNVLELLNIDAVKNNDLDARAADYGLTRNTAIKASGQVTINNTNITKRSTGLYVIKAAPIAGQNVIFVNNTTGWASSGNLYIARGTQSFEGPIAYTSIVQYPTYSQINLASALQKDHLISDVVIDSQGEPDRVITAGTVVKIPSNSQNPEIQYLTLRDVVIPSGEDHVDGVQVIAVIGGSQGNAGINTITSFDTPPFSGAAVFNSSAFSNGSDIETDVELRNRIKSYAVTLARGTSASIISAVIGVSDPDENKQVASAVLTEPVSIGEPSILYIDDGSGLQPSYAGQSVDTLLQNATGKEEYLQLANYPLPRPQVVNTQSGPFTVVSGSFLRVIVDGVEETIQFSSSDFINSSAATISEIMVAINNNSTLFKARFADNSAHILLYPVAFDVEVIQVSPQRDADSSELYINNLLKFPTNEFSYITLYKNSTLLHEKAKNASLETTAFATWSITAQGNIIISVDGTPAQDRTFSLSDFSGASSWGSLTLAEWVNVFNSKFAGLTAVATASQTMKITSNQTGAASSINVSSGTYLDKWFTSGVLTSIGQTSQFELNRQTGNLRVLNIVAGDSVTAGIEDAKGSAISAATTTGNYNLSTDINGRPSEIVIVTDSSYCNQRSLNLIVGSTISVTNPSGSVMRIRSSVTSTFQSILPGDFIYIVARNGWVSAANSGLFKVVAKGFDTSLGVITNIYIDIDNVGVVAESAGVADSLDIKAFNTDGFPQIWKASYLSNPASTSISDLVSSINTNILNLKATIYKSNSIKLTSTTEENGSIAIPVAVSNASALFSETSSAQFGNTPHIAHRVPSKDLVSNFKFTSPVSTNVFLGRHTYSDVKKSLITDTVPDVAPYVGTYSEVLDANLDNSSAGYGDLLSITRGNNRGQLRNIKAFPSSGNVGTQQGPARTELDYITGDELQVVSPIQLSTDDSVVFVMDKDQTVKSIDIKMSRTGKVNAGSGLGSFTPTNTEFSANDADNDSSVDFSNTTVWGTSINNTDFSDYAIWMRARNWYAGGGIGSGFGQMIVRAQQYGPNGETLRFAFAHPNSANQSPSTNYINTPSYSLYTYIFGSGSARAIAISSGYTISVKGPYVDSSTNFPSGTVGTGNYFDYAFSGGNFASVQVGDVLSVSVTSGVSNANIGQFRVAAKSGNTLRVFNPNGSTVVENITNASGISVFPISGNDVATIAATVNADNKVLISPVGTTSLKIVKATNEEDYSYSGNSTALGFGHNPSATNTRDHINLYDGISYCKAFSNSNPNFTLKAALTLNSVSSVYQMNTAPNADTSDTGEYFKLLPTSVKNIYHHLTQKALSQLPIVANISISNDRKRVQIDSKLLGSAGAIEVVGGNANKSQAYILAEAEDTSDTSGNYLLVKVPAFPDTFNSGDYVTIQNNAGVARLSRLQSSDTVDVTLSTDFSSYNFNSKTINVTSGTTFTITDVSSSYGRPSGFVWRWTHGGGATFATVNAGDTLMVSGTASGWNNTNKIQITGDNEIAGLPIIAVNNGSNYIDVINPIGVAMSSTAVGANIFKISAVPSIKWTLNHAVMTQVVSISGSGTVVTIITNNPHRLNTGDNVTIQDSLNIADGTYGTITVTNPTTFTFSHVSAVFNEGASGASIIKSGVTPTKYRVEKLGLNGMVRIAYSSGQTPNFIDSGVAVDDYVILGGTTFKSNNNGTFRVAAVDNTSIILINTQASDQLNTTLNMNNNSYQASWTTNTSFATGVAGTFKNVSVGSWVKKSDDPDSYYVQVASLSPTTPSSATQVNFTANYSGTTSTASGVIYDESSGYDQGVYLQSVDDITVLEGDSVMAGDTLSIQNIINVNWFNPSNIGTFGVVAFGTDGATLKPYIKVLNSSGLAESGRQMSVNVSGLYVTEGLVNKFHSVRQITRATLDDLTIDRRSLYMIPDNRSYKFSNTNNTSVTHIGKLGYSQDVTTGLDGYLYYTGLLRRVQHIVDGYEPDSANYPGRRAVGGLIETLPPLVKTISIDINVSTNNGINIGDISNNIKSVIINYVQGLGVGEDVILSEIIAQVMNIKGVAAVTFITPVPSTERITIANNERANIVPSDIGIA